MMLRIASAALVLLLTACGSAEPTSETTARATKSELYRMAIEDDATYQSLAKASGGLIQGGSSMKFLIDRRNRDKPTVYFMNGNYQGPCRTNLECARYHYDFAVQTLRIQHSIAQFNSSTYFSHDKDFVAATLNRYQLKDHGLVYAVQLYPQDVANEVEILKMTRAVNAVAPTLKLAFVATGDQQTTKTVAADLESDGTLNLSLNAILGQTNYFPLHQGEAWGYLRLFPANQDDLMPTDIPVFDELPLDLSVVAGVITRAYQDTNSHINLKSKERNTPNMVLRDAGAEQPLLKKFINKPVHMKVSAQGFIIEATTAQEVERRYKEKIRKPWTSLRWNQSAVILESFDRMCPAAVSVCLGKSVDFGSKAANMGFLKGVFRNKDLPQAAPLNYDPVPVGFGVPLSFYKVLIDAPENAAIKTKISALIKKEKSGLISVAERNSASAEIRTLILNAFVPESLLPKVLEMTKAVAPYVKKWKVRSSANAEDIDGFDGAGLHDSYSAKLSATDTADHACTLVPDEDPGEATKMKVEPKSFSCAIKGVYASLWNKRAIEERSFARIDHASVAMGLAILPSYDTEAAVQANSVVVTRVINSPEIFGYTLSIQEKNNTVTNPAPGTWSEQTIFAQSSADEPASLTTLRYARPTADGIDNTANVLPAETNLLMVRITQKVEEAYCRAKNGQYYAKNCSLVFSDASKPKSLDLEMKYLENGKFVLKQVREFSGR